MIRIAVCDWDAGTRTQLESWLWGLSGQTGQWQCDGYETAEALIKAIGSGRAEYQLVLVAVEWDGENRGFEMARQVTRLSPGTRILWLAVHPEGYAQQVFLEPVNLLGVLKKPVNRTILEQYIRKLVCVVPPVGGYLLIRRRGVVIRVDFQEILYLESSGHVVAVQTREKRYVSYGRLEDYLEQLPEYFVQCHKSYLVNMGRIRYLGKDGIRMDPNVTVPVSKSRYRSTKEQYGRFLGGGPIDDKKT